jgi:hypothetical protein
MSVDSHTRQQPTPPPAPARSGFNPLTLAIAALSSVAAAILVSKIWSGGTLWATAMTPVIVALVKEALERPAQKLDVGVSKLSTVRRVEPNALVIEEVEPGEPSEMTVYSARGHKWKIALVTGLLAFVVAAAVLTLPELVAGHSLLSGKKRTTLVPANVPDRKSTTKQQTETTTVTQTQATETVTQTVPSDTQTTPTVTQTTPTQTQTTPTTTTTPPSGGATTPTTTPTTPAP